MIKASAILDPTQSPAFQAWFSGSKVVDAEGSPQVVYHGTDKKFHSFNLDRTTQGIIWFTSDKSAVEAGDVGAQGQGFILEMYARIKNPAGWKEYDKFGIGELKGRGYDGVILPETDGTFTGIAFYPSQLKSVKNKGSWDPNNKRLMAKVAGNLTLWHGGNLDEAYDETMAHKKGRFEFGPGLYLTTRWETAQKYSKGSRKLYRVIIGNGNEASSTSIPMERALDFVRTYITKTKLKEVEAALARYASDLKANVFINTLINRDAIRATYSGKLREFLVQNGVDYEIVDNAFGWGERMIVLFNMRKIIEKKVVTPKDKIEVYDLPTEFAD